MPGSAHQAHQAQAKHRQLEKELAQAERRKAPRKDRKDLTAMLRQAQKDLETQSKSFHHALADYSKLPLEVDIRRVLRRLPSCPVA